MEPWLLNQNQTMKDLFTIQSESGQLWLDIAAQLAAKDAKIATITADRDRVAKLLADTRAALDSGDLERIKALASDADKTETEKKRAALEAEKARVEAELESLKA